MKPTYEELEQQLAESHRALRAETAAHDNVKMQLEKMAAENAGLKKFITQECHVAHVEPETFYEEEITRYVNADGYEPETPATDDFLAEVRAQGVDSAISTVIAMMNHQHPVTSKAIDILRAHAYQVRKGVRS